MCVCACVRVSVCVRACARACMHACVRACAGMYACDESVITFILSVECRLWLCTILLYVGIF